MQIDRLDHLVLTVADIDRTCAFYSSVLGFKVITFSKDQKALLFGRQKINLRLLGHAFEPKAGKPTPGSADLCFIALTPIKEVFVELEKAGFAVEEGPVGRIGAVGPMQSVYVRDPDGNLIEISNYS